MNFQGKVRRISASQTHALRHEVLRPGTTLPHLFFPGDDDAATAHFGAFLEELVGVASIYENAMPGELGRAMQLRGMAVSPAVQKQGVGRALIAACVEEAQRRGAKVFWCNARTKALGFYETLGFEPRGDEFEIPDAGPHFVCVLKL